MNDPAELDNLIKATVEALGIYAEARAVQATLAIITGQPKNEAAHAMTRAMAERMLRDLLIAQGKLVAENVVKGMLKK